MILITLPPGKYSNDIGFNTVTDPVKIAKAVFEASRLTDLKTHFDPAIHTLDVIAAGLPGFHPGVCREIDADSRPEDRYFRDAWEDTGTEIAVDMAKARGVHRRAISLARSREIFRLDKEIVGAEGDVLADLISLRQTVQDFDPRTFDLLPFSMLVDLKAAWPSELPERG